MTAGGGGRRRRTAAPTKTAAAGVDGRGLGGRAERSVYFARREAVKVLRSVLQGNARGRAVASIKTLGKASSMVAVALGPEPGWEVIDACSAPGNKTVHLAALMKGKGEVIACDLNESRIRCLEETIERSGATNIELLHGDFLSLSPKDPAYLKARSILLDPSCPGSGTTIKRLDHLLPSHIRGVSNTDRLEKLSAFQKKALAHALSYPSVQRVVYNTCSINHMENKDVVQSRSPTSIVPCFSTYSSLSTMGAPRASPL